MYHFYFDGAEAPITPGSVKFSVEGNNKTYTLIDEGEINVLKLPGLQEISFDLLLPTQEYPFANNSDLDPSLWLDRLKGYMEAKQPVQFVITRDSDTGGTFYGTSIRCSVESLTPEENADNYGMDTNVGVTLKEYKEYGTKTVTISKAREQDNAPQTPAEIGSDKADNPVALSKKYGVGASGIAKDNGYGNTQSDGTFSKNYSPPENSSALWYSSNKDSIKQGVTIKSNTNKTAQDFSNKAFDNANKKYQEKTGATYTRPTSESLLTKAITQLEEQGKKSTSNRFTLK